VLWRYYPTASDEATRAQAVEIIRQSAPLAALAGAGVILLPVGQPEGLSAEGARERLVDVLKECAPEAEKAGVVYGVENVGQPLARTVDDLLEIVTRVDSPACQVYYDVGNAAHQGADPVAGIRRLGSQLAMVHVKDFCRTEARRETVVIGDGVIDWGAVIGALSDIDYEGFLTLEVPGTAETADDIAERSRDALQQFMS
jgi:hexulose-6-phosphate isomerase